MVMVASQTAFEVAGTGDPERELAELARARGPLRRVAAALAAQWVSREGWSRLGYARLGDYARERLGVSPRSLQEWARVGRQLAELPALEAALVSGRLPWSKVRLLARFVTADDERHWIGVAAGASVRRLERELRAVDRGALDAGGLGLEDEGAGGEPVRWVRLRVPTSLAFKWQRTKRYAAKVEGQSLAEGDVLERVTAEVLSGLPVALETTDPLCPGVIEDAPAVRADSPEGSGWHPGFAEDPSEGPAELPVFLLPLLEGLFEADAFELDARLRCAVRLGQRLDAQLAPLLRHVTSAEYE
jgi:hypothetical protein